MRRYIFLAVVLVFCSSITAYSFVLKTIGLKRGLFDIIIAFSLIFFSPMFVFSATYSDSAHANASYGVLRGDEYLLPDPYVRGNCAHCHEQHASIGGDEPLPIDGEASAYLLLSGPDEEACFQCHGSAGVQSGGAITNNSYSVTFGGEGGGSSPPSTIEDAFAKNYTHELSAIQDGLATFSNGALSSDNNPCSGCHNVHKAKANWRYPDKPSQSAISLPTDHENLWGVDDSDPNTYETMKEYAEDAEVGTATYRAPFYKGATPDQMSTKHEPDGTSGSYLDAKVQGSTTLNYNAFCLECHKNTIGARRAINWGSTGDNHGFGEAGTTMKNQGPRIAPYTEDGTSNTSFDGSKNFVLSCTDCHEPHGSSNFDLLRTTVNGSPVDTNEAMSQLCYACHTQSNHGRSTCTDCHSHNGRF